MKGGLKADGAIKDERMRRKDWETEATDRDRKRTSGARARARARVCVCVCVSELLVFTTGRLGLPPS